MIKINNTQFLMLLFVGQNMCAVPEDSKNENCKLLRRGAVLVCMIPATLVVLGLVSEKYYLDWKHPRNNINQMKSWRDHQKNKKVANK